MEWYKKFIFVQFKKIGYRTMFYIKCHKEFPNFKPHYDNMNFSFNNYALLYRMIRYSRNMKKDNKWLLMDMI